jgi:hypothetical protein
MALDCMPMNSNGLSQRAAGLVLAGYALVFAHVAISTTARRDIT